MEKFSMPGLQGGDCKEEASTHSVVEGRLPGRSTTRLRPDGAIGVWKSEVEYYKQGKHHMERPERKRT